MHGKNILSSLVSILHETSLHDIFTLESKQQQITES